MYRHTLFSFVLVAVYGWFSPPVFTRLPCDIRLSEVLDYAVLIALSFYLGNWVYSRGFWQQYGKELEGVDDLPLHSIMFSLFDLLYYPFSNYENKERDAE